MWRTSLCLFFRSLTGEALSLLRSCSPTRRSYLTGRFPVHVSAVQAQPCDNTLPLQVTLLPEKLKKAPVPWATHFVGKGHLGYPTTDHLPVNRGFDTHVGVRSPPTGRIYRTR